MKIKNNPFAAIFIFFLLPSQVFSQLPGMRKNVPVTQPVSNHNGNNREMVKIDTAVPLHPINPVRAANYYSDLANAFSLLQFSVLNPPGEGFPAWWQFDKSCEQEITEAPLSKNWKKQLTWRKIPAGAVYGKWEISTLPFPPGDEPGSGGILRTGTIETKGADSVVFEINYVDEANRMLYKRNPGPGLNGSVKPVNPSGNENRKIKPVSKDPGNPGVFSKITELNIMKLYGDGTRKFYIRIIPLDGAKQTMFKISNGVTVREVKAKAWKEPETKIYLENDYTVTSVKYVPVHQREPLYSCCVIVTGYQDEEKYIKEARELIKKEFPVGRIICPKPPEDKAWYEKAFNGVTGFITEAINGAAQYYNETKSYVKDKAISTLCSKAPSGTKGGCEIAAGAAFDYGMAALGVPPSLPNIDDLTKMARGELVELAIAKVEAEAELPIPDDLKEQFRKEFHDKVVASAAKGTMNDGMLNLKADPRGEFQTAYLEIEVTRTSELFKGKGIAGFFVSDNTTRTFNDWNAKEKKYQPVNLSINLFEESGTRVPFLEKTGDKTTIFVVLKPQESYTWIDKNSGMIQGVHKSAQTNEYVTPPLPTYEGYTQTSGFQILCNGGSATKFSFGLKTAANVSTVFINQ
jgi:hypothetical protein